MTGISVGKVEGRGGPGIKENKKIYIWNSNNTSF